MNMRRIFTFSLALFSLSGFAQILPTMPQVFIETCVPPSTDTLRVCNGSNCDFNNSELQKAIDAAQPGTVILLEAGASYTGPFSLPEKDNPDGAWITIRTAASDSDLPDANTRITPASAAVLPKIIAPAFLSAITTKSRTNHWYFLGVEFASAAYSYNIVAIGNGESVESNLPSDFTFDRVYAHGHPTEGSRRAFAANGRRIALVNSWVSDCKEVGADSQAFCAWNGTIYKLVNNYLEGAGENVMFGGAKPAIVGMVPSDIEVRGNHFFKPLSWAIWSSEYAGTPWSVKNIFELKNAQRVLVQGNVLEQNWAHAQVGFAVVITPRTENGTAPWAKVADVIWENNILRNTASGFNISGRDNNLPTEITNRILIRNNLIEDLDPVVWGNGAGRAFQILHGALNLTIEHNTVLNKGNSFITADVPSAPILNFIFKDNIVSHAAYGVKGSGTGVGNSTFNLYFPQVVFTNNAITDGTAGNGGTPANYPPGNFFPANMSNIGFVNFNGGQAGDYHLNSGSPFHLAATDGLDIGADFDTLLAWTAGALSGIYSGCTEVVSDVYESGAASSNPGLRIYPNPGREYFKIWGAAAVKIEVWDAFGQLRLTVDSGDYANTSVLPNGIYWVRVSGKNQTHTFRWIRA